MVWSSLIAAMATLALKALNAPQQALNVFGAGQVPLNAKLHPALGADSRDECGGLDTRAKASRGKKTLRTCHQFPALESLTARGFGF